MFELMSKGGGPVNIGIVVHYQMRYVQSFSLDVPHRWKWNTNTQSDKFDQVHQVISDEKLGDIGIYVTICV